MNRYGSGHSEAIVTDSTESARRSPTGWTPPAVYVNASTRFTDGAVFGMGAEIGNSTQKLHARGPIGAARADHLQVRGRGIRPGPRVVLARRHPRRSVQPAAHRPPGLRAGGAGAARAGPAVFVPVGAAAAPGARGRPGRRGSARDGGAGDRRRRALRVVARSRSTARGPPTRPTRCAQLREEAPDDELFLILGGDQAAALRAVARARAGAGAGAGRGRGAHELVAQRDRRSRWAGCAAPSGSATSTCRSCRSPRPRCAGAWLTGGRSATWCPTRWRTTSRSTSSTGRRARTSSRWRTRRWPRPRRERAGDATRPRWPSASRRSPRTARRSTSA